MTDLNKEMVNTSRFSQGDHFKRAQILKYRILQMMKI